MPPTEVFDFVEGADLVALVGWVGQAMDEEEDSHGRICLQLEQRPRGLTPNPDGRRDPMNLH